MTVHLTEDGNARLTAAYREQNAREGQLLSGLSTEEIGVLTELMRRVSSTRISSDDPGISPAER